MKSSDHESVARIIREKSVWLSGLYVLEDGPMVAVIIATADPELFDITVFNYSFIGHGDEQFFAYERLVWPVGAENIYHYVLIDEINLELDITISVEDIDGEIELSDLEPGDIEDFVHLLAPHLQPLLPLAGSDYTLGVLVQDEEEFGANHPDLARRSTPDFWDAD